MSGIPQPRRVFTLDELLDSLNQKNPQIDTVRKMLKNNADSIMTIYKKDNSLYELVTGRVGTFRLPIIDKPLQMVIEARDSHESITGALFCYHVAANGRDPEIYDRRIWGEMYHKQGYGYYFSGAWGHAGRNVIISDYAYKPDPFDKDLMIELGLLP